jgi:hypothetical protein
VINAEDTASKS